MSRTVINGWVLACAAVLGLSGVASAQVGYHSPAFQRVAGYPYGGGFPASGYPGYGSFNSDFGFAQPYSYGYSFYRPYPDVYRPFYYASGFHRPGFGGHHRAFRPGYGACGAYGYGAYGYGAGAFGY